MRISALFFLVIVSTFTSCGSKDEGILPEITGITEAVYASATIEPENLYQAYAAAPGIIDARFVKEGDAVQTGQPLYRIADVSSQLSKESARLALEQSLRNYKGDQNIVLELKAEIEAAKLKYLNDSTLYERQKELWNKQVGSKVDLENRKLAFELSRTQWQNAIKRKKRTENELANQVQQAENKLRSTAIMQNDHLVISRVNGKVYALYKEPGEFVSVQERVALVGDSAKFTIRLSVDEVDITRIQTGQTVWLRLEAYRGRVFEARVTLVLPKMDERNQTFLVEAEFIAAPERLYMGLTGEANIVVYQKEKALVIPREYLFNGKVRTQQGEIEVKTGLASMSHIEITSGLDERTRIFKPSAK